MACIGSRLDAEAHLGYRKGKRSGAWFVRWRNHHDGANYKQAPIGVANDLNDKFAEGTLTFEQAVTQAREHVTPFREKVRCSYPILHRAERMLGCLTADTHCIGIVVKPILNFLQNGLVPLARDATQILFHIAVTNHQVGTVPQPGRFGAVAPVTVGETQCNAGPVQYHEPGQHIRALNLITN
ncbi:hypothetical protein [Bradyrhizobium genosp. A]|uniref:hypothetical protein n=1 Tax=Bradyrhizobium genosp. A TaxID=83626 RepID=UPI003CE8FCC8